jgi:dihydropteroate synthase
LAALDRTAVMAVVNVTPDSFSDGGRWAEPGAAIVHGVELALAGADIVDVGGESTRPGAGRVPERTELERVLPVVEALAGRGIPVSIDTTRAEVATRAVRAGAVIVNDVSGGLADPAMLGAVADLGVVVVLSHWRGPSAIMDGLDHYTDVVAEVRAELGERVDAAVAAGVRPERIVVDPGLGFAKAGAHNWPLLADLGRLAPAGLPVLVGASRKRFLADALEAGGAGEPAGGRARAPLDRDAATVAVTALAAAAGVWAVRVHDPAPNADATRIARAWRAVPKELP